MGNWPTFQVPRRTFRTNLALGSNSYLVTILLSDRIEPPLRIFLPLIHLCFYSSLIISTILLRGYFIIMSTNNKTHNIKKRSFTQLTPTDDSPIAQNINRILTAAQQGSNDNDEPNPKHQHFIKLTHEQFTQLLDTCTRQQATIDQLTATPLTLINSPILMLA
jgi:hypothetical protein